MRARLLLAVIVVPAFTLTAQQEGGAAPSGATTARAASERLRQARARSASIDDKRVDKTPANRTSARILERLRSAVRVGVIDTEAGAAEDISLLPAGFSPYPMPWGIARAAFAEAAEKVYPATRAIEKPEPRPAWQPTVSSGSACWWLWVFTGMPVCW
jgi:hypothetical protein